MKRVFFALSILAVLSLGSSPAAADEVFRLNLMGGVGGPLDQDAAGLSNSSFQVGFSVEPEDQLLVGLRVGQIDFGDVLLDTVFASGVDYATLTGEYRFTETFYESGLFIGLGLYRLDGTTFFGESFEEESVGLVLGITGEFLITTSVGFVLEFSGHLSNLDTIDTMVAGHAGISVHF